MKIEKRSLAGYFLTKKTRLIVFYMAVSICLISCAATYQQPVYSEQKTFSPIDYGDLTNWAAHPWKNDMSDKVPEPLERNYKPDSLADVFFIHPTTYTSKKYTQWNADITDSVLNTKTDNTTILYQATAFNAVCRVFAPRYRQTHIQAFFITDSLSKTYFDNAYEDVKNAFQYYLEHFNNGRPIIIASHSQGTKHAKRLLKEFFDGKELQKQLVCAYIIGLPVTKDYFTKIPVCHDSLSTGCVISWRTFKDNYKPPADKLKENIEAIVVNPLTWKTDESYASKKLNKGGVLRNFSKIVPNAASAQIHGNILWSSKPDIPGKIFYVNKNYHIGDINLYYMNIRQNTTARVHSFLEKNKH